MNVSLRKSWVEVPQDSDFPIQNLPFGVFSTYGKGKRVGVAIGDRVLDLAMAFESGLFVESLHLQENIFDKDYLNDLLKLGRSGISSVRNRVAQLLNDNNEDREGIKLFKRSEVTMHLPVFVRDYTDFYSSLEHATNVGTMFRGKENALMPNWRYMPIAYHGRSSSIFASGQNVLRPKGQVLNTETGIPEFGPTRKLDFELELAFVVCGETKPGQMVSTYEAHDYIAGLLLFNDWSARDIQAWEYQPLGPFLGKSFASSVSHWLVTMDALEPFRTTGPIQNPKPLPYLRTDSSKNYDINLEVCMNTGEMDYPVSKTNAKYLYWNIYQQLAHHTSNGCKINVGDLMASGTISGPGRSETGSLLELTWNGNRPLKIGNDQRTFLEDGDEVILKGYAKNKDFRIGFGELRNRVKREFLDK